MGGSGSKGKVADEGVVNEALKDEDKMLDHTEVAKIDGDDNATEPDDELNEKVQDVMKDNLEIMRDIVFRIREDEEFAKSIYANCPRLQNLLDEHPDLRPIFEDPKLVRINFEKVYRDQGGVLPEDEEEEEEPGFFGRKYEALMGIIAIVTSHPLFKVFKILMIVKKIIVFMSPSKGLGVIRGFFEGIFDDSGADPDADADADQPNGNPANMEMKMQLNAAADHMEDPEVQERMEEMLENPDQMDEIIENDPQLKALRDGNELCRALMSDPDTMQILTDPDNLRALAEAPDLIEQDFADPGGFVPDEIPDADADVPDADADVPDADADLDQDVDNDQDLDGDEQGDDDEEDGDGEEDGDDDEDDDDDDDMYDKIADDRDNVDKDKGDAKGLKGKGQDQRKGAKSESEKDEAKSWFQAATGVLGGQVLESLGIGEMFGGDEDLGGDLGGGEDLGGDLDGGEDLGGTEDLRVEGADSPEVEAPEEPEAPEVLEEDALGAEETGPEEDAGVEEDEGEGMQVGEVDGGKGAKGGKSAQSGKAVTAQGAEEGQKSGFFGAAFGAAAGFAAGTALASMFGEGGMDMAQDFRDDMDDQEDDEDETKKGEEGEEKKTGRFKVFGAMKDFAKDQLIGGALGTIVGDDLADDLLDTQEDIAELEEEEGAEDDDEGENCSGKELAGNSGVDQRGSQQDEDEEKQPSHRPDP